jgi:phosphatidylserine/phosphatidylglycerophosphate/cardiolipin synthase-like enzyme
MSKKRNEVPASHFARRISSILGALGVLLAAIATLLISAEELNAPTDPTPVTVQGEWWQVYFTEPVGSNDPALFVNGIDQYLAQAINAAQSTIDIAAFEFNLPSLTQTLIQAHRRGVRVRFVTDDEHGLEDEDSTLGDLVKAGITVIDDDRSDLMHNKFIIIDGRQVWTGSWNLTLNGTFRNNNNVIAIDSAELAAIYTREFEEMFGDRAFGPRSPSFSDSNEQKVIINDTPIQVYFAPEDEVGEKLAKLIDGAQSRVRFMAFSFTHDEIGQAVMQRAHAGVTVEGIFESRGSKTQYSELTAFYCDNLAVRTDGNPRTFHHKVFIIDDETVVLGSFNFSAGADEGNDENVLIVTNAEIAARYNAEFDKRWLEAEQVDDVVCE